jgi:transcriptional regulator with XRE-family HTH domain
MFGSRLRSARKDASQSQGDLSRVCGLHLSEISKIETGRREPRLLTILIISDGLSLHARWRCLSV